MKVALFRNVEFNFETVSGGDSFDKSTDYVRISEIVDVELPERDPAELVPEHVSLLKEKKEKAHTEYLKQASLIDDQISKLMAITAQ